MRWAGTRGRGADGKNGTSPPDAPHATRGLDREAATTSAGVD